MPRVTQWLRRARAWVYERLPPIVILTTAALLLALFVVALTAL